MLLRLYTTTTTTPTEGQVLAQGLTQMLLLANVAAVAPVRGPVEAPTHALGQRHKQLGIQIGGGGSVFRLLRIRLFQGGCGEGIVANEAEPGAELHGGQTRPSGTEQPGEGEKAEQQWKQLRLLLKTADYKVSVQS